MASAVPDVVQPDRPDSKPPFTMPPPVPPVTLNVYVEVCDPDAAVPVIVIG